MDRGALFDLIVFFFGFFPLAVHDVKRSNEILPHHPEAGHGGEAERNQH